MQYIVETISNESHNIMKIAQIRVHTHVKVGEFRDSSFKYKFQLKFFFFYLEFNSILTPTFLNRLKLFNLKLYFVFLLQVVECNYLK